MNAARAEKQPSVMTGWLAILQEFVKDHAEAPFQSTVALRLNRRPMSEIDPRSTALILVDLQDGIAGMPLAPRSGGDIVVGVKDAVAGFRAAGALVVLVRVAWAADFADAPRQAVDRSMPRPPGGLSANWSTVWSTLETLS